MFVLQDRLGNVVFETASYNLFVEEINDKLVCPNWGRLSSSVLKSTLLSQNSHFDDVINVVTSLGYVAHYNGELY